MNFAVEYYLVFINPEFTLYNAPTDERIIFPTQLNRFIKKLHMKNPKTQERHLNFAKQLVSEHIANPPPFMELPKYSYEGMEKMVFCPLCNEPLNKIEHKKTFICRKCGHAESVEGAVLRNVGEFRLLFPERQITTNEIFEWCKVVRCKKTVQRILAKNFKQVGNSGLSHYE